MTASRGSGGLETDPVLTTVVTTDLDFGMIRGVRFETRGTGPNVKFSAAKLWETSEDVDICIRILDLSKLTWLKEGVCRNQTYWMDSSDFDVEAHHKERGQLSELELEDLCI